MKSKADATEGETKKEDEDYEEEQFRKWVKEVSCQHGKTILMETSKKSLPASRKRL